MDDRQFDNLTRTLATGISRRSALKAGAAALAGLLAVRRPAGAQVTQAHCGNQVCASNPGGCTPGCVCCVYSNGNSRCRPPGTCSGGTEVVPTSPPPTTPPPTTPPPPTTSAPTTTATPAPSTTTAAPTTTATTTPSPTTTAQPTTTSAPIATSTTTAPPAGVCSGQPNGTSCIPDNRCIQGATCLNGTCSGGTATVCEEANEICNDFVCDPATGACVYTPRTGGAFDRKGCDVCVACIGGECAPGVDTLDCGPCATCDRSLQACVAKPVGSDCGSTCTQRATCSATGSCVLTPNSDGCFNFDVCSAKVCNEATAQCEETGAKDGQACGDDPCKECRGGQCVAKSCSSCERCDPSTGFCVVCEHCCRGVCGLEECGNPNFCCGGQNTCCDAGDGDLACLNRSTTCEGVCFWDPVTCCGTARDGVLRTCPAGETCCFGGNEPACCPAGYTCCQIGCCPPGQVCGAFGCQAG